MNILIQMGDSYPDESPCAKRMRVFHDIFTRDGHHVTVMAPKSTNSIEGTEDTIYCPTIPLKKKTSIYRFLNSYVFGMTSFFKAMKVKNVDVVVTTAPPPLINLWGLRIARNHHAKLVYDVRDVWPDVAWEMGSFSKDSIYSRIFEYIRNSMLKKADMTIAVSAGKVKKLRGYAPNKKVIEITNGLDEDFLLNEDDKSVVNKYKLDDGFCVSYIGNLGLAQGLKQLLEVAKKAQNEEMNVRFLLFGSGAEERILKEFVSDNKLRNVEFPGRIPNREIFTVLKHSKMNFVSLVNENLKDSVPTKMYEALGVGCPVLLAACGDSAEILKNSGLGIAVKPNDAEALWCAFKEMHDNLSEYEMRKNTGIQYIIDNYSRQEAAKEFEKELESLLSE